MPTENPKTASIWGLLIAQFSNAFNDNAWKLMVPLLAMRGQDPTRDGYDSALQHQMTLGMLAFTMPLILLSLPAGSVADRLSKRSLLIGTKSFEFVLMIGAALALLFGPHGVFPFVILGLLGLQSALLSPAKYGILPEIVPHDRLSWANGALSMWTFLAIIVGTFVGGLLLMIPDANLWAGGVVLIAVSAGGLLASFYIPRVPAAGEPQPIAAVVRGAWSAMKRDRVLKLAVWGSVLFWGLMSLLGQDVLVYAKALTRHRPDSDTLASIPAVIFGVGIGAGSMLAGRWSAGKIEYGLMPLGAVLFGATTLFMAIFTPGFGWTCALMVVLGTASGLILVPLNALVQWRAPSRRRGAVIALENVFVFTAVLGGSVIAATLGHLQYSAVTILFVAAGLTLAGTVWALKLLPDALLRLVLVLLTQTLYRLRVVGRQHIPMRGGGLIVPNHVSFVDGLFILAALDRPVRFLVDADYFKHPLLKPFMRSLKAIPISSTSEPRAILRGLRDAGNYLEAGELVCIFAEGQITRTGMTQPFRRGLERIVKGRNAPIIPAYLDGVWGSIFSREGGRFLLKLPKHIPYPVTVAFGEPMPPDSGLPALRRAVQELSAESWLHNKLDRKPLHHRFVRYSRLHPFKFCYADPRRDRMGRFAALTASVALARTLRSHWKDQAHVGVLLPPSIAGAVANIAASLSGRASVNLNYTAGASGMNSAVRQAELKTLLTSRQFLEAAKLDLPEGVKPLWIEDLSASMSWPQKVWSTILAMCLPVRWLERACGAARPVDVDDLATIIFSSGSTGEPKGVMLSHFNVCCNVDAGAQALRFEADDRMLGILPLFHSFGYVALWFVNNYQMGFAFQPNPVDAVAIGQQVARYRLTIMVATPTFLQIYLRRCTPAQFGSLRLVVVGAEKLSRSIAEAFEDQFGVRPLEGYGTTECSPVVAANVPDFRAPGFYQPGSRRGTVGLPLPGIAVRVVDPETFEPLPVNTPGMLLVKGANVMRGYVGRPDLTAEVLRDGWYVTGDIAMLDEDSFITITDRLSRFSKIGGEMVPHGGVEQALQEAAGVTDQCFVVTGIPDDRKGEALAVLHTLADERIDPILQRLSNSGLPKLFVPRRDYFVSVDALPMLGSGKLDLKQIKAIAKAKLLD